MPQSICRVVIRKPFHDFLYRKAKELCTQDMGEVVNYLVLQQMKAESGGAIAPIATQPSESEDYSDLSGLLGG